MDILQPLHDADANHPINRKDDAVEEGENEMPSLDETMQGDGGMEG